MLPKLLDQINEIMAQMEARRRAYLAEVGLQQRVRQKVSGWLGIDFDPDMVSRDDVLNAKMSKTRGAVEE
jgi:heat shock protein HspQ